jgi:hypothetical protein
MSPVTTNYVTDLGNVFVSYADLVANQSIVEIQLYIFIQNPIYPNGGGFKYIFYSPQSNSFGDGITVSVIGAPYYNAATLTVKKGYTATFSVSTTGPFPDSTTKIFSEGYYNFNPQNTENTYYYTLLSIDAV